MDEGITIRDLRPDDVDALVDIALAAWAPIYASYRQLLGEALFAAAFPDWRAEKARQIRAACAPGRPGTVCVAEQAGRIVGFTSLYLHRATGKGEIGNNAVHPDVQGQGIGTRLCRHAVERLREQGARFVLVGTGGDPSHAPARRMYEQAGFTSSVPGVTYYLLLSQQADTGRERA